MSAWTGRWRVLAIAVLLAWGALAFGAVYPWAFAPLFAGAALLGIVLCASPGEPASRFERRAALALAAISVVPLVQLVPLPAGVLAAVSPGTDAILREIRIGYPMFRPWHPLSIVPSATLVGLAAAASLSVLLVGLSRRMTGEEARRIVRAIAWIGLVMSVAGLVQQAMWNGRIYGVWQPRQVGEPFGPFVNRNHFAGWVLMALPLVAAYAGARLARGLQAARGGGRVRWLASPDGTHALLAAFAAAVMAVALVMSLSRSGVVCLAAATTVTLVVIARRRRAALAVLAAAALIAVIAVGVASTGVDRLTARFGHEDVATFGDRAGVWSDTWRIARRFPLAGTGLNTFGHAALVYQTTRMEVHYREAHNEYLQILAEGGVLLAVPALLAGIAFARLVRRRFREVEPGSTDYWLRVGAVTGLAGIALQSLADFSLQMPGNALLFVVVLAIAARRVTAVNSLS
jgi:O-antigen ligase